MIEKLNTNQSGIHIYFVLVRNLYISKSNNRQKFFKLILPLILVAQDFLFIDPDYQKPKKEF